MTTVLIADDHPLVRQGLRAVLASDEGLELLAEAADGPAVVRLAADLGPDVVLMDLQMPLIDGIEATRQIVGREVPAPRVLILTGSDEPDALQRARAAGASGFLTKNLSAGALMDALTGLVSIAAAFLPEVGPGTAL